MVKVKRTAADRRHEEMTKSYNVRAKTTVRGGFPVFVYAFIGDAEPDVGIMSIYVDEIEVVTTRITTLPFNLTEKEIEACEKAAIEQYKADDDAFIRELASDHL